MIGKAWMALTFSMATIFCGIGFAQLTSDTVERIIEDSSLSAIEKGIKLTALGEEGVPKLLSYLDDHPESWRSIVPVLGDIGDRRATEPLLKRLDAEPTELRAVVLALGKLKDPKAVQPLVELLGNIHSDAIVSALASIGDLRAETPILEFLDSQERSVEDRIRAASALLDFASEDAQGIAKAFLIQDEYLHRLHEEQKPVDHPYWRFPHDVWWESLLAIGSDDSYNMLSSWFSKAPMHYHRERLIKLFKDIAEPPRSVLDALLDYALNGDRGEMYLRVSALEALTGYGDALPKETILSAFDSLQAESELHGLSVPLQRLNDIRSNFDARWGGGFFSRESAEGGLAGGAKRLQGEQPDSPPDAASILAASSEKSDEPTVAAETAQSEEPQDSGWSGGMLVVSIGALAFLLAFAGYQVFSKKGRAAQ